MWVLFTRYLKRFHVWLWNTLLVQNFTALLQTRIWSLWWPLSQKLQATDCRWSQTEKRSLWTAGSVCCPETMHCLDHSSAPNCLGTVFFFFFFLTCALLLIPKLEVSWRQGLKLTLQPISLAHFQPTGCLLNRFACPDALAFKCEKIKHADLSVLAFLLQIIDEVPGKTLIPVDSSLAQRQCTSLKSYSVQFSRSVMSDFLRLHGLQHARLPCPSPVPGACSTYVRWVSDAI